MTRRHGANNTTPLSRRRFLGASAAALALPACDPGQASRSGETALGSPPAGPEDAAWERIRAQFVLEPGTAYMNNASLGMPPASVAEAVGAGYRALSEEPLHGKHDLQDVVANHVLPRLAAFVGAKPDEITLTHNASEALHFGALGLDLAEGDEVLTTTQEHPAGRRPWEFRAARHGIRVKEVFVPSPFVSEDQVVSIFREAIGPRTKAIAFCHVTRGGHLYPVRKLAALAREHGLLCHVDGAQAVGMFPVHLGELGVDTYSVSLHKWMLGPSGTGFLYVREGARARVHSVFAADATPEAPNYGAPGTADLPVRAGLLAALDFMEAIGIEAVADRARYLSDHLKARLAELDGLSPLSGPTPETSCPGSTIFELEGVDALEAVPLIETRARIHIDEHQRDGHNAIRVSTHVYNTTDEVDRLVDALGGLRA